MSRCYVPPRYCELHMVQLKYLAVQLFYPLPGTAVSRSTYFEGSIGRHSIEYDTQMLKLHKQSCELEAVVWKCKGLQTFRLMLRTESVESFVNDEGYLDYRALTVDNHWDAKDLVLVFLNAARCKHFKTAAVEDKTFLVESSGDYKSVEIESYRDPIVSWYNLDAEVIGVNVSFEERGPMTEHRRCASSMKMTCHVLSTDTPAFVPKKVMANERRSAGPEVY